MTAWSHRSGDQTGPSALPGSCWVLRAAGTSTGTGTGSGSRGTVGAQTL